MTCIYLVFRAHLLPEEEEEEEEEEEDSDVSGNVAARFSQSCLSTGILYKPGVLRPKREREVLISPF